MKIYESAEDYLERILVLGKRHGTVRSIDIAEDMNFSKPSISIAMKKLKENGLINIDEKNCITLTPEGLKIAAKIYDRHQTLTQAMMLLGVKKEIAEKDACKIEHVISEETFEAVKEHINKHNNQ